MKTSNALLEKAAQFAGAGMFITGALILGPVGLLLFLGVFYSMMVQNLAMGVVTGLLCASPMIFLVLWASLKWASVIQSRYPRKLTSDSYLGQTRY